MDYRLMIGQKKRNLSRQGCLNVYADLPEAGFMDEKSFHFFFFVAFLVILEAKQGSACIP